MSTFEDLCRELGVDLSDPETRLAWDLAGTGDGLLEALVAIRKARGLTRQDMADALGRRRSYVSAFECLAADPTLRTVLRYAAAVGARITVNVEAVDGLTYDSGEEA